MRDFSSAFQSVTGTVYCMLVVNLATTGMSLPLLALLLASDLRDSWLWVLAASPLTLMGVAASFAVFREMGTGNYDALRTYGRELRRTARRILPVALAGAGTGGVLWVDGQALRAWGVGSLSAAGLVLIGIVLAALVGPAAVGLVERADLSRRHVVVWTLHLCAREWGWTLVNLGTLGALALMLSTKPVLACGFAVGPCLYVLWAGSRRTARPLLSPAPTTSAPLHLPTSTH